jgi:hypothetical protein
MNGLGNYPVNSTEFGNYLDYVKTFENRMWIATVSDVIKYHDEFMNAKIMSDELNDSVFKIRLDDNLDDTIYNQLLSLKIRIPDNWDDNIQVQGAEYIKTLVIDNNKFLWINALPNNQLITIQPLRIRNIKSQTFMRFLSVDPNPFNDLLNIAFEVLEQPCNVYIKIVSVNGQDMYNEKINNLLSINNLAINTSDFPKGLYVLKIETKNQILLKKLIKP